MSDRRRAKVTKELLDKEYVSSEDKKRALATVLYETRNAYPFMGAVLQSMNIMYTHMIPTAGIMFNTDALGYVDKSQVLLPQTTPRTQEARPV